MRAPLSVPRPIVAATGCGIASLRSKRHRVDLDQPKDEPIETLKLVDGRDLAYDTYDDRDGLPVIFSHGFADSRIIGNPDNDLTASLGLWMIAADEPGVGGSSPQNGRRMVDWGADMEQLADSLGLDTFAVAGHSGGGPHKVSIAVRHSTA